MGENVRETKELDIIIQIQNAVSRLLMNVGYAERVYDGQYKQFLRWKNSLPDTELIDALELITEHETNLSKERKRIDLEKNAVAEVIEIFGESVLNYSLIEIQNILKQDNLSFAGKRLSPVWVALLNGLDSLGKPDLTPTLIKEVQSYADDGLVHPEYREVKRHFALIRAREIITGCRELNNQPQISKAEDRHGAEPVKAGKAKSNTAKAVVYLFFDKHINDSNSKYHVLRESQGKGKRVNVFVGLWEMFNREHSEWVKDKDDSKSKGIGRDSFSTYLNMWRKPTEN